MAIRCKLFLIEARHWALAMALMGLACMPSLALANEGEAVRELPADRAPTYVDLVEMAAQSDFVGIVLVDDQITVPPERAPGVPMGEVRLYIEGLTQSVLASPRPIGEELVFLVDRPLNDKGKAPKIEKQTFLAFGDLNPDRPRDLQLLSSDTLFTIGPVIEQRVREVLSQLAAVDRPAAITGIKDVISIPGNLAGESETQIFVETQEGAPVSMNVIRRPGMAPRWGISFGDIVDPSARPPERETLAWYQFACHLPREMPEEAFLQRDRNARAQAREDYAYILDDLGSCERRF